MNWKISSGNERSYGNLLIFVVLFAHVVRVYVLVCLFVHLFVCLFVCLFVFTPIG